MEQGLENRRVVVVVLFKALFLSRPLLEGGWQSAAVHKRPGWNMSRKYTIMLVSIGKLYYFRLT